MRISKNPNSSSGIRLPQATVKTIKKVKARMILETGEDVTVPQAIEYLVQFWEKHREEKEK